MKKRFLQIAIVLFILLFTSGCKEKTKLLTFNDEKNNYTVTMKVPSDSLFNITEYQKDDNGKINEFTLENTSLNITADIYFFESYSGYFAESIESRKTKDNFKEYIFNSNKAYTYSQSASSENIIVLVNSSKEKEIVFYMYIDALDYSKNTNLNKTINSEAFQNMLNTIEFTK